MSDLIERKDALDCLDRGDFDSYEDYSRTFDTIEDIPSVNRWIPCSERLPELLQNVIVCTDIKTVTVAWLNGDHWTFADTGCGHTENWSFDAVKYWMHLPEPPER